MLSLEISIENRQILTRYALKDAAGKYRLLASHERHAMVTAQRNCRRSLDRFD
ncbi:MAG: hypothetical protein OXD44_10685 [Gammaproteobacteria bacterium]|nr:hypothetical protein [Gammaproteobacteria bacterium]MCY4226885.1 hypothetical protein [Gammaproteobacteria bacterium]MCY4314131.1 hypothetical protein [Gammaproteobacteria bacterium]